MIPSLAIRALMLYRRDLVEVPAGWSSRLSAALATRLPQTTRARTVDFNPDLGDVFPRTAAPDPRNDAGCDAKGLRELDAAERAGSDHLDITLGQF